jgi:nicotinamide riboside transporter PnuC
MDLPRKLLLGLTSLFASIASIIISFCTGHIFVLKYQLRSVAYPLYAATCLPVTFFALAQLPLYFDLMRAIIKKVPQRNHEAHPH